MISCPLNVSMNSLSMKSADLFRKSVMKSFCPTEAVSFISPLPHPAPARPGTRVMGYIRDTNSTMLLTDATNVSIYIHLT